MYMFVGFMYYYECFNVLRFNLFIKYIYMIMKLCYSMFYLIVIGIL